MFFPGSPVIIVFPGSPYQTSCPRCPFDAVLWRLSDSGWSRFGSPILVALSWQPVFLAVLFWQPCPGSAPVLVVLSRQYCSGSPILPVRYSLSCFHCPVLAALHASCIRPRIVLICWCRSFAYSCIACMQRIKRVWSRRRVKDSKGEGWDQHHATWDSWLASWDWSGWRFLSMCPRPPSQGFVSCKTDKPYWFFSPLQIKNKPHKGLLAWLQTSVLLFLFHSACESIPFCLFRSSLSIPWVLFCLGPVLPAMFRITHSVLYFFWPSYSGYMYTLFAVLSWPPYYCSSILPLHFFQMDNTWEF